MKKLTQEDMKTDIQNPYRKKDYKAIYKELKEKYKENGEDIFIETFMKKIGIKDGKYMLKVKGYPTMIKTSRKDILQYV